MSHRTTAGFWRRHDRLPQNIQQAARKNFRLLKADPLHPSLHFKKIGKLWSVQLLRTWGKTGMPRRFTAVVELDAETGLYVGYVPGFPGAYSQASSLDELNANPREVIEMLLENGEPQWDAQNGARASRPHCWFYFKLAGETPALLWRRALEYFQSAAFATSPALTGFCSI